jgi:hypothetical protein
MNRQPDWIVRYEVTNGQHGKTYTPHIHCPYCFADHEYPEVLTSEYCKKCGKYIGKFER